MIPRQQFNQDHDIFRESVRKFLDKEVAPYHAQWEKDGQVDKALWKKAGEQGLLCPTIDPQYGGVGVNFRYNAIINEEVSGGGFSGVGWTLHSDIAVPYIANYGSDYLKDKYLQACVSGDIVTAIAMTEPGTGSDLQNIKTSAKLDGDHYIINGSKTFITNGQHADLVVVVAKTEAGEGSKGISLFLVDADTPGFNKGKNLEKVGLKAQDTSELFFEDAKIPKENLLLW